MKLLLENWRKLLEGEVIDFPTPVPEPKVSEEDMQRVIALEADIAGLLTEFYGNIARVPIEVDEALEPIINAVEASLKK